ncbi:MULTISPECIES: FGGY-family carbohydrate kinase [Paraburkholderia]|uniref:xylulokinase n=1 Tax=Paraburkholderia TaxID=1822464 RepID=UPI002257427A|nr:MULTISPECIES: FGGY-family carbohydrate kinase [Paraburkholderia]MCX4160922.1 FGGY-family carbohydrate kinase [Paraburkholderia megapolitana]MDN7156418.1 FGGY-family carbohydrate kinase [Paraburkholderia sp. CHISQ3]MDQ6493463.1 FGGY-family carbohydrate kinase [Paraburkholderia megapolitana]
MPLRNESYVLAIDLGTSGAKVALVTTAGRVVAHEKEHVDLILGEGGLAEQDPHQWWQAICSASRRLLQRQAVPAEAIVAACAGSQWSCTVAIDANGMPLRHAHSWLDSRGHKQARRVVGGWVRVPGTPYGARKLMTWLRRTGGAPSIDGKDPIGHIHWIRAEEPEIYAATRWFLDAPEYLTLRLSGRATATPDSIVPRWCTDNRDLSKVQYDEKLLALSGIERTKLPDLVPAASVVGPVTPQARLDLGLTGEREIAVVAGVGDTIAAAIGAGAVGDYQPYLYVGTSAWYSYHLPDKRADVMRSVFTLPSVVPERYWAVAIQETAGKALEWLLDNIIFASDAFTSDGRSDDALVRLNGVGMTAPAGSNGVIFTPWLNGERTPIDDNTIRGGWHNLSLSTTRADLVRSVIEGVMFNCRWMIECADRLADSRHRPMSAPIRFIGGGATSSLLCQIAANISGRSIAQVRDPVSANLRGAGILGAIGTGHLKWSQVADSVEIAQIFSPESEFRQRYDDMFKTFVRIYEKNKPVYRRFNTGFRTA